jgi:F0F1-type ATP synthase assembly protein I
MIRGWCSATGWGFWGFRIQFKIVFLDIYIYIYIYFTCTHWNTATIVKGNRTQFFLQNSKFCLVISLPLYASSSWPEFSSLKSVFAPFVGASRFYKILIFIIIFTESHTVLRQFNTVPFFMSWFIVVNFNNILTSKFFQIFCYTEFCQQSHAFLIYFILGTHEAYLSPFKIVNERVKGRRFFFSKISPITSYLFSPRIVSRCG